MSCLIQEAKHTAAIADFICTLLDIGGGGHSYEVYGISCPSELYDVFKDCKESGGFGHYADQIYAKLRRMNYLAYEGRYSKEEGHISSDDFLAFEPYKENRIYKHGEYLAYEVEGDDKYIRPTRTVNRFKIEKWHYQILRYLHFYLYQISEDGVFGTDFFKAIEALKQELESFIVRNQPDYAKLAWA